MLARVATERLPIRITEHLRLARRQSPDAVADRRRDDKHLESADGRRSDEPHYRLRQSVHPDRAQRLMVARQSAHLRSHGERQTDVVLLAGLI